ncbi:MAG: aldo/keto reductase [Neptuniibacter sp.]
MTKLAMSPRKKELVLGTALWGWGVDKANAFKLLDCFVLRGGKIIDTATNYPINKKEKDCGVALKWIKEWLLLNENADLFVIVKVGAVNNLGSSEVDLSANHIKRTAERLCDVFGKHLSCISIHWDSRAEALGGLSSIEETVAAMVSLRKQGLDIGMSGVKFPRLYFEAAPALQNDWLIQVKENIPSNFSRLTYEEFFPQARFLAYGINMGGLKEKNDRVDSSIQLRGVLLSQSIRQVLSRFLASEHGFVPRPNTYNQLALASTYTNISLSGVILGPRNVLQLIESMDYWDELKTNLGESLHGYEIFQVLKSRILKVDS